MSSGMALNQQKMAKELHYVNVPASDISSITESMSKVAIGQKATVQDAIYANVPRADVDQLADKIAAVSLQSRKPQPTERGKNVTIQRERRVKPEEPKENDNTGDERANCRAPIGGVTSEQFEVEAQYINVSLQPSTGANYVNQRVPGQKWTANGGHEEQIYHNLQFAAGPNKVLRPQYYNDVDRQRMEMLQRNSFAQNRKPVEHTDPTAIYYNAPAQQQQQMDKYKYTNVSQRPNPCAISGNKAPISSPRHGPASSECFAQQHFQAESALPHLNSQDTARILSEASLPANRKDEYVNIGSGFALTTSAPVHNRQQFGGSGQMYYSGHDSQTFLSKSHTPMPSSHSAAIHERCADPKMLSYLGPINNGFSSPGYGFSQSGSPPVLQHQTAHFQSHSPSCSQSPSPISQHAYSHSPQSQHGLPSSPQSQQGYPPSPQSNRGYPSSPQSQPGYAQSPQSHQGYAQSPQSHQSYVMSPQSQHSYPQGYHHGAYSPETASMQQNYPPSISPSGSQNVPSPLSSSTITSPLDEQTFYPMPDSNKCSDLNFWNQQENLSSLTEQLVGMSESVGLEDFQHLPPHTTSSSLYVSSSENSYPITTAPSFQEYRTDTQSQFDLNECLDHALDIQSTPLDRIGHQPQPLGLAQTNAGGAPQVSLPVSSTAVVTSANTAPNKKIAIPKLPKPTKAPAPMVPGQHIILVVQAVPAQPKKVQNILPKPTSDGDVVKEPNTKTKGGRSKKSNGAKTGGRPDPKTETINARAMIAVSSDEQLLRKERGETVFHTAILLKNQAVILAILHATRTRPALVPLIEMMNTKGQTPLFMSVITAQPWLTDVLIKMKANCDTLCKFEISEGHVEELTALHYASKHGNRCMKELQAILASSSTNVDCPSRGGMTALHLALWNHGKVDSKTRQIIDSKNVIKCLLDAGAQCTIGDTKSGKTALHFAVDSGSIDLTRMLLESTGQPSTLIGVHNYDLRTALHFAVSLRAVSEEAKIDMVKYLISKGANKNSKDKDKHTPRDLVNPAETKLLALFTEYTSPSSTYPTSDDDDSYIVQSP